MSTPTTTFKPNAWSGKSILIIGQEGTTDEVVQSLGRGGCRITLATFPAPTPTSTSTPTPSTSSSTSTTDASASFDLEPQSKTYAQLTEIFQRMRRANGGTGLDGVLVWMPSGVVGAPTPENPHKAQIPHLIRLITFVTKLTAFEFRWARDGEGGAGAGVAGVKELVFVTPCPVTSKTMLDPVEAASANSVLGVLRSTADQATLDGFRLWMFCLEEPTEGEGLGSTDLLKAFNQVIQSHQGQSVPTADKNGPIYIAKKDGVEIVDRPDGVLLRAEAYKRLAERGAFAAILGTRIRDFIISFTLFADNLGVQPRQLATYVGQAMLFLYVYLWWKGWFGIPKIVWLFVGMGLWTVGSKAIKGRSAQTGRPPRKVGGKRPTAVFLGSGGHTSEALQLLRALDLDVYTPRTYIHSSGDAMSVEKAVAFERDISNGQGQYDFVELPRARKVGQSYASSIGTTLNSFVTAFRVLTIAPLRAGGRRWEVLLINGPGTCVVVAFALMLPRLVGLHSPRVIYVESWARVKSLSLSGKILKHIVDKFIVQWDEVDRTDATWTARSGEVMDRDKGRVTTLGEYHGWMI